MKDKIFDLTVELYCKVKNLIFLISLNQLDKIIFFYKTKVVRTVFFYLCVKYEFIWTKFSAQTWSSSAKKANIGFFAPKPYLKGVDPDFLLDRKFCLVEILKH